MKYTIPLHIFFHYTRIMEKDLCRGLYTSLFCVIIPTLFPYFLRFWYIPTSCYILNVFYYLCIYSLGTRPFARGNYIACYIILYCFVSDIFYVSMQDATRSSSPPCTYNYAVHDDQLSTIKLMIIDKNLCIYCVTSILAS